MAQKHIYGKFESTRHGKCAKISIFKIPFFFSYIHDDINVRRKF